MSKYNNARKVLQKFRKVNTLFLSLSHPSPSLSTYLSFYSLKIENASMILSKNAVKEDRSVKKTKAPRLCHIEHSQGRAQDFQIVGALGKFRCRVKEI